MLGKDLTPSQKRNLRRAAQRRKNNSDVYCPNQHLLMRAPLECIKKKYPNTDVEVLADGDVIVEPQHCTICNPIIGVYCEDCGLSIADKKMSRLQYIARYPSLFKKLSNDKTVVFHVDTKYCSECRTVDVTCENGHKSKILVRNMNAASKEQLRLNNRCVRQNLPFQCEMCDDIVDRVQHRYRPSQLTNVTVHNVVFDWSRQNDIVRATTSFHGCVTDVSTHSGFSNLSVTVQLFSRKDLHFKYVDTCAPNLNFKPKQLPIERGKDGKFCVVLRGMQLSEENGLIHPGKTCKIYCKDNCKNHALTFIEILQILRKK